MSTDAKVSPGPLDENQDPKTKLTYFLQKYIGRCMRKGDLIFETNVVEGRFKCTLQAMCIEGEPSYEGEKEVNKKKAEQSAAATMVEDFIDDINTLQGDKDAFKGGGAKRKATTEGASEGNGKGDDADADTADPKAKKIRKREEALKAFQGKSKLLDLLMQLQKKCPTKDDVLWKTEEIPMGKERTYKTTVTLPMMSEKLGNTEYEGKVMKGKKESEHAAAEACVAALIEDPEIAVVWNQYFAQKSYLADMYHSGINPYKMTKEQEDALWQKMCKEMAVGEGSVTGKIVSLKKGYGYITPDTKIDHKMAERGNGDVYFSFNVVDGEFKEAEEGKREPPEWLKEGTSVSFKVYADMHTGLGAMEVKST